MRPKTSPPVRALRARDGKRARPAATPAADAARELAVAGQHAQAIDVATAALQAAPGEVWSRLALLDVRAESLAALAETARARSDVDEMIAIAERHATPASAAQAYSALSRVLALSGEDQAAFAAADRAAKTARRSRQKRLIATGLLRRAEAGGPRRVDAEAALDDARGAERLFRELGDKVRRGRAFHAMSIAHYDLGHAADCERAATEALALARDAGDRYGEGGALNLLYRMHGDLAVQLRGLREALAAHEAGGYVRSQAGVYNNLCLTYAPLGLHRRARRTILHALAMFRRVHDGGAVVNALLIQSVVESRAGDIAAQRRCVEEAAALNATLPERIQDATVALCRGMVAKSSGNTAASMPFFEESARGVAGRAETSYEIGFLTLLSEASLAAGLADKALDASTRATALYRTRERHSMDTMISPADVFWRHHRALSAHGKDAQADKALASAYRLLLEAIDTLSDEGLRRSFLNKLEPHREIVRAWIAHARRRRLSAKRQSAHLAGAADLRAPFERLADIGMRLNELRSVAELQEFLIDEVTELSGAERVLLVLEGDGGPTLAGALRAAGRRRRRAAADPDTPRSTNRGARARSRCVTSRTAHPRSTSARA